ncbi:MAG: class I SAM-dependent methyltransferase [Chloroflexota bacterium]
MPPAPDDLLWAHLTSVPAFRALLRSVEARLLSQIAMPEPILDLGCGDGHFASLALSGPVLAGMDVSRRSLEEARARRVYQLLLQGTANALPFADGAFATVVSNCAIEHIPNLEGILREVHRVLRGGGLFVFTVPSEHFVEYLLFYRLFTKLRLWRLASAYGRWFTGISGHLRYYDPFAWKQVLQEHGFIIVSWRYYLSRAAHSLFDLLHYYSAPCLAYKKLLGRWTLLPWRPNFWLVERLLRGYYAQDQPHDGAYLLLQARKRNVKRET